MQGFPLNTACEEKARLLPSARCGGVGLLSSHSRVESCDPDAKETRWQRTGRFRGQRKKDGGRRFTRGRGVGIAQQQLGETLNRNERRTQLVRDEAEGLGARLVALPLRRDVFSDQQQSARFRK